MAAWETRCHLALGGSWYLCPYRAPASRGEDTEQWIEAALKQPEQGQAVTQTDEKIGEVKTMAHVYHWSRRQECDGPQGQVTWDEQVLVTHSLALQQGLITRREGKQVVDQTLDQFGLTGLVTITLTAEVHKDGGQRWLVADYQHH